MKKILFFILFSIVSLSAFADGITGIFGIEFGKTSTEVKSAMEEKGWKLSKTDGTTQYYKKPKGTYASLVVDELKLYFYEDKFYDAFITFPYSTKTEDVITAVKAIQESYELTLVNQDSGTESGIEVLLYSYVDPKMNIFKLIAMGNKSISICTFELSDFSISAEKKAVEEKRKTKKLKRKIRVYLQICNFYKHDLI